MSRRPIQSRPRGEEAVEVGRGLHPEERKKQRDRLVNEETRAFKVPVAAL